MKNKLKDLNNHLFAQLERLSDEDLTAKELDKEIGRTKAIVAVSDEIVSAATLQVDAARLVANHGAGITQFLPETASGATKPAPKQIEGHKSDER